MAAILKLKNIKFQYDAGDFVLQVNHFKIGQKENVFVSGPQGSGKSTFLAIMAGILSPQEGSVVLMGEDLQKMPAEQKEKFLSRHIAYIPAVPSLANTENVRENLAIYYRQRPEYFPQIQPDTLGQQIKNVAEQLGLDLYLEQPVAGLAPGQQLRVAAARALLSQPRLVIADEALWAGSEEYEQFFIRLLANRVNSYGGSLVMAGTQAPAEIFRQQIDMRQINSQPVFSQPLAAARPKPDRL